MMDKEKNLTQAAEAEAAAVEARRKQEMEDNPFLVFFKKPFTFEGVSYESVDLSGLESLSAADMIAVNKTIERGGTVNVLPEMSLEYACIFASKATKIPVEFFQALPPKEAIKVKNKVTNFFYGED